jgi:hypothetical protein
MFTALPPGARLGRHHDPVASSLGYHLGLLTPNPDNCALILGGITYPWVNGEDLRLTKPTCIALSIRRTSRKRCGKNAAASPAKRFAEAVNYAMVAKFTGANDEGKLSWFMGLSPNLQSAFLCEAADQAEKHRRFSRHQVRHHRIRLVRGVLHSLGRIEPALNR